MSIELQVNADASGTQVRVSGEVDLATAPELAAALETAIPTGGTIVLDLTDVEFIDTSGVRTMLDARRMVDDDGNAGLTVVAPPGSPARRLLELTELIEALAVVDSIDDAPTDGG